MVFCYHGAMAAHNRLRQTTAYRVLRFALRRGLIILTTIFVGVFITVLAANRSGQIEAAISDQIYEDASRIYRQSEYWHRGINSEERNAYIEPVYELLADEAGLNLPFLQRHLRWTWKAMTFQWGDVQFLKFSALGGNSSASVTVGAAILSRVPNTLLLIGPANLLVFLIGLPAALFIARNLGSRLDRLFALLAPLSSVPSWVIGLVLVLIFAVQVHWLPIGGKTGVVVDLDPVVYRLTVLKHMILPVSAIVLSLLFQFVYAWRSYFLVYADEDYVELARARGLSDRVLERRHILRPTLPFIITSFSLSLVSFWQTTIALEVVFNWPGIGKLYIDSLPNFFGEGLFPGDLVITIALVTIFAYLLGFTILVLEIFYALVDPRVQVDSSNLSLARRRQSLLERFSNRRKAFRPPPEPLTTLSTETSFELPESVETDVQSDLRLTLDRVGRELRRYPSAIAGLVIIFLLVLGSIYAVVWLPYGEVGLEWYVSSATGSTYVPKTAMPEWTNLFRAEPLLSRLIYDSRLPDPQIAQSFEVDPSGVVAEQIIFTFDYDYAMIPEEVFVYFNTRYAEKRTFVFWTLIRPDGREIQLGGVTPLRRQKVELEDYVFSGPRERREAEGAFPALADLNEHEQALHYLFADLEAEPGTPLRGQYQLVVDGLIFEEDSWIESELVLLGQLHGPVGTDIRRRDLLVPLMWGMPFAMSIGLVGALFTISVSLFAAAAGVWVGGKADSLVQRISDIHMVLPILAISVIFYVYYGLNLWVVLGIIVLFGAFGSPTKNFRSAFLQIKQEPYIEAARAYGVSNWRIITRYMIPRIMPVLIPQLITLVPGFVFLEATMGLFNIRSNYPTWGKVIYEALKHGLSWGSRFWVLQPLALLLLTGLAFAMIGLALDRIFNPKQDYG